MNYPNPKKPKTEAPSPKRESAKKTPQAKKPGSNQKGLIFQPGQGTSQDVW